MTSKFTQTLTQMEIYVMIYFSSVGPDFNVSGYWSRANVSCNKSNVFMSNSLRDLGITSSNFSKVDMVSTETSRVLFMSHSLRDLGTTTFSFRKVELVATGISLQIIPLYKRYRATNATALQIAPRYKCYRAKKYIALQKVQSYKWYQALIDSKLQIVPHYGLIRLSHLNTKTSKTCRSS